MHIAVWKYLHRGPMIYLVDNFDDEFSHGKFVTEIICRHSDAKIIPILLSKDPTFKEIIDLILSIFPIVLPDDIVLCPWAVDANQMIDEIFEKLSDLCWVVVAAGNYNQDIKFWSPARAENVLTVACLNKSGIKAALSNWSSGKELVWVAGTNYNVGWKNSSGTSVSAAVYAALLAESFKEKENDLLDCLLQQYQENLR